MGAILDSYVDALAPPRWLTRPRRTCASKVRQYLTWLAAADTAGGALNTGDGDCCIETKRGNRSCPRRPQGAPGNHEIS